MLLLEWRDASGGCALCLERSVPVMLAEMKQQGAELLHIDQVTRVVAPAPGGASKGRPAPSLAMPGACAAVRVSPPGPPSWQERLWAVTCGIWPRVAPESPQAGSLFARLAGPQVWHNLSLQLHEYMVSSAPVLEA